MVPSGQYSQVETRFSLTVPSAFSGARLDCQPSAVWSKLTSFSPGSRLILIQPGSKYSTVVFCLASVGIAVAAVGIDVAVRLPFGS